MKYHVIADEDTVKGFSLLGVEGTVIFSTQTAKQQTGFALFNAFCDKKLGAVIITRSIANTVRPIIEKHRQSGNFPEIIEIL
jgi:vacuolar-type H+-ATPase subunit F/Vma7